MSIPACCPSARDLHRLTVPVHRRLHIDSGNTRGGAPAAALLGLRGGRAGGRVAARLRKVLVDERRRRTSEAVPEQQTQR